MFNSTTNQWKITKNSENLHLFLMELGLLFPTLWVSQSMLWIHSYKLLSKCYNVGAGSWFFSKPAATSQSSYDILAILYLLCIIERILYLIDDITIILTCCRYMVIDCYLSVIMLWRVHEHRIAKSDFPKFPDDVL